jgi:hypothetical protein
VNKLILLAFLATVAIAFLSLQKRKLRLEVRLNTNPGDEKVGAETQV